LESNIANSDNINITSSASTIFLGKNYNDSFPTNFNFGELIIYDRALTVKEMDLVTKYLSKKWGIKI
jgi:hypothetical protein